MEDLTCKICDYTAQNSNVLQKHIKSVHDATKEKCDICEKDVLHLRLHKRNNHGHYKYRCNQEGCRYEDRSSNGLNRHTKQKHLKITEACNFCDKKYSSKGNLRLHVITIHKNFCSYVAQSGTYLKKHIKYKHLGERDKCTICNIEVSSLYSHNKNIHPKGPLLKCEKCEFTCKTKSSLKQHFQNKHEERTKIICGICKKYYVDRESLREHMKIHSGSDVLQRIKCDECDYTTISTGRLTRHVKGVHRKIVTKCKLCDYQATFKENLLRHMKTFHSKTRNFECYECDEKFKLKGTLKKHIDAKHLQIKQTCLICQAEVQCLRNHMRQVHERNIEYQCTAENCKFVTNDTKALEKHKMRRHNTDKIDTTKCEKCEKDVWVKDFQAHTMRHNKPQKIHKCPACEVQRKDPTSLKRHIKKVHDKVTDRNFACSKCDKKYGQKGHLRTHIQTIHSDEKFSCENCPYTVTTEKCLRRHIRWVHARVRPTNMLQCKVCDAEFKSKGDLAKHEQRKIPCQPKSILPPSDVFRMIFNL